MTEPGAQSAHPTTASSKVTSSAGDRQMFMVQTVKIRKGGTESKPPPEAPTGVRSGMGDNWFESDAALARPRVAAIDQPVRQQLVAMLGQD